MRTTDELKDAFIIVRVSTTIKESLIKKAGKLKLSEFLRPHFKKIVNES